MDRSFPEVLDIEQAAELLRATPDQVVAELEIGRLRGFRVGDEWRTTKENLMDFIQKQSQTAVVEPTQMPIPDVGDDAWEPAQPFAFRWPKRSNQSDEEVTEHHDEAYRGTVRIGTRSIEILIGFTSREAAGMHDRKRVNVFFGRPPSLQPIVEFAGANDFDASGKLASVVKLPSGKHLRPGDEVPEEYRDLQLGIYSEVVVGPNAAGSVAVIAHRDELSVMARHALIRARWKELL